MKTHRLFKVAMISMGFLSLAGCHSNPLLKVSKDNCNFVKGFLSNTSMTAERKLQLDMGNSLGNGYASCMEKKLKAETCQKLFQGMVEEGNRIKVVKDDLSGAALFRVDQLAIDDLKDPAVYSFAFVQCQ